MVAFKILGKIEILQISLANTLRWKHGRLTLFKVGVSTCGRGG